MTPKMQPTWWPREGFLGEETGAMTVFGIFVFMVMAVLSAVAVDVANLMAARNQLQVAADVAGHSALYYRDIEPGLTTTEVKLKAIETAQYGMPSATFGEVLEETDITFGDWDHEAQTFTQDDASRNAVMVTTSRLAAKSNSVGSLLFNFVGVSDFDIVTPAVFTTYRPMCFREGFVADGVVDLQSNNGYANGFCIHSNDHVEMNSNNTFEAGTVVSMPDENSIVLPQSGFETNAGLEAALRSGYYRLRIINRIDDIIDAMRDGDLEYLPDYINSYTAVTLSKKTLTEADLLPGKRYIWNCSGLGNPTINSTTKIENVVIVADCAIKFGGGTVLENVRIATTSTSSKSINSPASLQIGLDDNCAEGGDVQIVTKGGMEFAADLMLYGSQLIAERDIEFTANADGIEGASMVAGGTISGTSNMTMGFCGTGMTNNFEAEYFRLAF